MRTVLSCAEDTVLSDISASIHWEVLEDRPGPVHVSSQTGRRPTDARVVHRLRGGPLHPEDRLTRNGIPTTSLARTILDVAEGSPAQLEAALNEAYFLYGLNLNMIRRAAARAPGRHALKPIAALLAEYSDGTTWTRTRLERALKRIIAAAGVPKPYFNHPFGRFSIDAAWPDIKLAIEVDGRRAHSAPLNFERDRVKQNALALDGWLVLRFTWNRVQRHPEQVAAEIAPAYAQRLLAEARP